MASIEAQQNLNSIPVLGLVPEQVSADPGSLVEGRVWTRTDLHNIRVYLNAVVKTLATTDDTRFTDSRTPNGAAGGDLAGTYPNPTVGANKITLAHIALALIESGVSSGTAATTDPALRKLGTGANDALAGNTRLDQLAVPTVDVSMNSHKLTNLLDGTNPFDAVTKGQMEAFLQGLDGKESVQYASSAPVNVGTAIPAATATANLGGIGSSAGSNNKRILIKDQALPQENGIYIVSSVNPGVSITLQRALDMDTQFEVQGAFVFVEDTSTSVPNTGWVAKGGTTFGTTPIVWTQFSAAGQYTGGAGLTLTGVDFAVNVDNSSIEINADALRVKAAGITNAMLQNGSIDLTTKVVGVLPVANGGTGGATAAQARTALGFTIGFAGTSPALVAGTYTDVVHGLGLRAKSVTFVTATGENQVELDWRNKAGSETTTIQIKTDIAGGRAIGFYLVYVVA